MQILDADADPQRMTTAEREALEFQLKRGVARRKPKKRKPEPPPPASRRVASGFMDGVQRLAELPARIGPQKNASDVLGTRILCYLFIFFFPPGWLMLLLYSWLRLGEPVAFTVTGVRARDERPCTVVLRARTADAARRRAEKKGIVVGKVQWGVVSDR